MIRIKSLLDSFRTVAERFTQRPSAAFRTYGVIVTRFGFAFVFVTFGLQKVVIPGGSPVDAPIIAVAEVLRFETLAPLSWTPVLVGGYEVLLGLCFLGNRLRAATALFVPHQIVSFATLILIPSFVFDPPIPFAYDTFGAFVLKNVVFVGAFLLLLAAHLQSTEESVG